MKVKLVKSDEVVELLNVVVIKNTLKCVIVHNNKIEAVNCSEVSTEVKDESPKLYESKLVKLNKQRKILIAKRQSNFKESPVQITICPEAASTFFKDCRSLWDEYYITEEKSPTLYEKWDTYMNNLHKKRYCNDKEDMP